MATNTSILGLSKPAYTDDADVAVINSNSDLIDAEAGRTRANFAAEYSTSSAYAVGAFCTHAGILYQCNTAIGSGGEAWTSGHWTQISAGDALVANNQAIASVKDYGTVNNCDSLNSVKSTLSSLLSGMADGTKKVAYIKTSATFDLFTSGITYFVELKRYSGNYANANIQQLAGTNIILGTYTNTGGWSFSEIIDITDYIESVTASVTLASIGANSYASNTVDVDTPAGKTHAFIAPQYTSNGFPVAGAYVSSGAPAGKTRFTIGVYNFTNTALTNVTATIRVLFY